jgi:integrase
MVNKSIEETGRSKSITKEQYQNILDLAKKNLRDWFFLYLIGNWGLRVGEAIRLRVEDFSFRDKTVKIPRIKIRGKGILERGKLSGSWDEMPFEERPIEHLEGYLNTYNIKEGWLFPGLNSLHLSESRAQKIFYFYSRKIGIKASIHSLRHYKGYSLYKSTIDILAVKTVLRHRSIRSSEIYTEPTLEMKRRIMSTGGYVDHTGFYQEDQYTEDDKKKLRVHNIVTKKRWKRVPA